MIKRHADYTKSQKAFKVLALWEEMVPKFVKVMPKDYKRVLQALKQGARRTASAATKPSWPPSRPTPATCARIGGG